MKDSSSILFDIIKEAEKYLDERHEDNLRNIVIKMTPELFKEARIDEQTIDRSLMSLEGHTIYFEVDEEIKEGYLIGAY